MKSLLFIIIIVSFIAITNGQHADYRPNPRFGSDIKNYKITTTIRTTTAKQDPDSFFFGFFPLWSAVLVGLTMSCLALSLVGVICWLIGCINPIAAMRREASMAKKLQKIQNEEQVYSDQYYDDISMRMLDTIDKNNSNLFNNSKLVSEYDASSSYGGMKYEMDPKLKKKIFRREHL